MRIAIKKSTGRVIEMQSDATEGTLIKNAISCGIDGSDVEERVVSQAEYDALMDGQKEPKTRNQEYVSRGATIEALVVAMWEKDHTEIARLEGIRQKVKRDIPNNTAETVRTK